MKAFFLFITLLLLNVLAIAQTDSLEQKLIQYKKLFDSGLITEKEYEEVKAKALQIPVTKKEEINLGDQSITKAENQELNKLRKRYRESFAVGISFACIAPAFLVTALVIADKDIPYSSTYEHDKKNQRDLSLLFGLVGGVFTIGSFYGFVDGTTYSHKYYRKIDTLGLSINQNGIGLRYTIK